MSTDLVLSLFPGIGLLDMAFEGEDFCVVRGPDALWGGDVKRFHPPAGKFNGVIGGPPCQAFSRLRHIVESNGYKTAENLIPEFERVITEAQPSWFLMENVPDAPLPVVQGYAVDALLLNNRWLGEVQNRVRRFSFGVRGESAVSLWRFIELAPLEAAEWEPGVMASGGSRPVPVALVKDKNGGHRTKKSALKNWEYTTSGGALRRACRLQGLPEDFLEHAPFTSAGKHKVVGNGVPLPMGQAMAKAVRAAIGSMDREKAA